MDGGDQTAGSACGVEEAPPPDRSKLLGAVDQDCVPMGHRSRQLGAYGAPRSWAAPGDQHDNWLLEPAGQLLEERGFAAALGADHGSAPAEVVQVLREVVPLQPGSTEAECLDSMAGEGVFSGSAHTKSTSTGVGPISRSRRSVRPLGRATSSIAHARVMSLPENE